MYSVSVGLPVLSISCKKIIVCDLSCLAAFTEQDISEVACVSSLFLFLSNTPLYICTTICFSICSLVDIELFPPSGCWYENLDTKKKKRKFGYKSLGPCFQGPKCLGPCLHLFFGIYT